jgi:metal-responsive CopG/Arc/MetJ family transcriptional regulator
MGTNVEIPDVLDEQVGAIAEREGYASKSELVREAVRDLIEESDYKFAICQECGTVGFSWDAEGGLPGNCPFCNEGPYTRLRS